MADTIPFKGCNRSKQRLGNTMRTLLMVWWTLNSLFGVAWSGVCPSQCRCNDDQPSADCSDGHLDIVPHVLNPRVTVLLARSNQIRRLDGMLSFYEHLQILDLSYNELKHLGRMQFVNQQSLHQLNLSNNFVSSLYPDTFHGPAALQTLDLSYNILGDLKNSTFHALTLLVELRLGHNKINTVASEAFAGLSRLRVLHLDHNLIEVLDSSWMTPLENLRFLYLTNNHISQLDADSFRPLTALKVLTLQGNKIHNIAQTAFRGPRSLDTLELSSNQLSSVPNAALTQLPQLLTLDFSHNPVKQLTRSSFQSLFTLETLFLNSMEQLTSVDGHSFLDNAKLSKLHLENNPQLSPLPWGIFVSNTQLREVSFKNNTSWVTLAPHQLPQQSLRKLFLEGIPFHCNCSLIWLWELCQRANETNLMVDNATCVSSSTSPSANNHPNVLENMSPDDLACDDWTQILVLLSASILGVIFVLLIVSAAWYKYRTFRRRDKYGGTPCFHIKDDTMVYRSTLGPSLKSARNPPHASDSGQYSPEPFYEVPEEPKSSSTSSGSKYSSSGYIGSELWDADYFAASSGSPALTAVAPSLGTTAAHCYVNPVHHQSSNRMNLFPNQGSSGSTDSGTSTASHASTTARQLGPYFSPSRKNGTNSTLMWSYKNYNNPPTGAQYSTAAFHNAFQKPDKVSSSEATVTLSPRQITHKQHNDQIRSPKSRDRSFKANVYV